MVSRYGLSCCERFLVQHLGVRGRLVDVVFKNSQPVKTMSFKIGQRNKILDQWRLVVGALAQADGAHLRQRTDRLGQSAAHGLNAGDHCGGHGAQAHHHYAQFARCGRNLCGGLLAALLLQSTLLLLTFLCCCCSLSTI